MDLQRLRYFVVLAEELHFGQAARRLYLSQPALSTAIRTLERSLGVRLFERTSRRVELSRAGAALLPDARRLLTAEDQLRANAVRQRSQDGAAGGILRVALFVNGLDALTQPVHDAFRRTHPGVCLQTRGHARYDDHLQMVARRSIDVLVARPPYEPVDGVSLVPLLVEPAVAVLRRDDPRADASELAPEALLDDVWPNIPEAPPAWAAYWSLDRLRNGETRRLNASPVLAAGEDLALVEHGCGITVTALSRARRDLYDPLVAVPLADTSSLVALAVRDDHDQAVDDYITTAQRVVQELVALVPRAALPPAPARERGQDPNRSQ